MMDPEAALRYAAENRQKALEDLKALVSIPSISTNPEHQADMQETAASIAARLAELGFHGTRIMQTKKHPIIFGEFSTSEAQAPTVLLYGHYDVQPVDPLAEWQSQPFTPTIRGDALYARGSSDMKAQLVAFLSAMEAIAHTSQIPVHIKTLIEGEEEIGSPSLREFITQNAELLACDFCLNVDSGIVGPDTPSITYALRGLAYFEINVHGPKSDLHSGRFGGVVDNPAMVLCEAIAGMRNRQGRILLPGFYDAVRPLSERERQDLAKLPTSADWWQEQTGAPALFGEEGYSATERGTARPTLDVNGLYSGFIEEGQKTVLPAHSMAKLSTRLVADQTPDAVERSLREYLEKHMPDTVTWELRRLSDSPPAIVELDSAAVRAASAALAKVWGKIPLLTREGGTVPVVGYLKEILGVNTLMLGFGLPDDNIHAPNERQHIPTFFRGIDTYIHFLHQLTA
jgi:acetylornithine deacetylase/succinyl-diaminopimelate desuccinylase-like protein